MSTSKIPVIELTPAQLAWVGRFVRRSGRNKAWLAAIFVGHPFDGVFGTDGDWSN